MLGLWCRVWVVALFGGCLAALEQNRYYEEPMLICGEDHLEYTLQLLATNISTRLSVYDTYGNGIPLVSNDSCGIWITPESDGYVVIRALYDGCYMLQMEDNYTMTIFLEVNTTGEWEVYQKEDLMCPFSEVKDAPSPTECSAVLAGSRLACANPPVSQDVCVQNGCCYDQTDPRTPCYYGNRVTAQCTTDGMLSVAVSRYVTLPSLILTSVTFPAASGSGCGPVAQNADFLLFSFSLSTCGTTQTVIGSNVVYENDLVADKNVISWQGSSITRDSTFRLHIRCSYAGSDAVVPLSVEVFTLPPPSPASSLGPLNMEMRIALDAQYQQYYLDGDYPIVKVLRDPVYVEVRILNRRDPGVMLVLNQCWATATPDPEQLPQWPILVDGCPFPGDNYMTQPLAVQDRSLEFPLYYKRFIVSTFSFVTVGQASLSGLVYFHCSASACVPSPQTTCVPTCAARRRRSINNLEPTTVVSAGRPIEFYMDAGDQISEEYKDEAYHGSLVWIWAVMAGSVFSVIIILTVWLKKRNVYAIKDVSI